MSLFSKIFKYKADVEDNVVSLITSSLGYIESTSDYIVLWCIPICSQRHTIMYQEHSMKDKGRR